MNKNKLLIVFITAMLSTVMILTGVNMAAAAMPDKETTSDPQPITTPIPSPTPTTNPQENILHDTGTIKTVLDLPGNIETEINNAAELYGLQPELVRAVIYTESRGQIDADNGICYGLMQLNREYEQAFIDGSRVANIENPVNNVYAGCWYLSELMQWADNNEALALMAYNMGQSKAKEYYSSGIITSYAENVQAAKALF